MKFKLKIKKIQNQKSMIQLKTKKEKVVLVKVNI